MRRLGSWARLGATLLGIVVLIAGTFAPWVASGASTRSVYGAAGAGGRLLRLSRSGSVAIAALPFVSLAFAVALLLWIAGRDSVAAVLMLVLDVATAAGGAAMGFAPHTGPVHVVAFGPIVAISGAVINSAAILTPPTVRALRRRRYRGVRPDRLRPPLT